jgi:hypothetical protein
MYQPTKAITDPPPPKHNLSKYPCERQANQKRPFQPSIKVSVSMSSHLQLQK